MNETDEEKLKKADENRRRRGRQVENSEENTHGELTAPHYLIKYIFCNSTPHLERSNNVCFANKLTLLEVVMLLCSSPYPFLY